MKELGLTVEVISAYRFHMFHLAGELERRRSLCRLHTALPARLVPEVSRDLVRSHPLLAAPYHVLGHRVRRLEPRMRRMVVSDFDRWVARGLQHAPVVTALSSFGTRALQRAAADGSKIVCDRGSWHILEQKAVLERESARWGIPGPAFDPWIVDRELTEYDVADRIFVPSSTAAASFHRRGIQALRIRVVPYGVDASAFRPSANCAQEDATVISVAHVTLGKGHQYLISAYRRVRRPGSRLRLVGDVDRRLLARLRVTDDDIDATGPLKRPEVACQLQRAGIFALASVTEGLALVIPQAMACGLPVIATDATGVGDIVEDGVEGLIVPTGDEGAFAEALESLLDDPERARAMGKAGRRKVEKLGGWESYGAHALAEFEALLRW